MVIKNTKMDIEELNVYRLSMDLGEDVWGVVSDWKYFEKDTVGKQLVRAADSIAANLSEGFGRYHYKEAKHFYYYSRGSLFETKTWITKAYNRKLITDIKYNKFRKEIKNISIKLNNFIKSVGKVSENQVKEDNNDFLNYSGLTTE